MAKKKATRRNFGSIRERNGKFEASYKMLGKTYYGPHQFVDRTSANRWLNGEHTLILDGTWTKPGTLSPLNTTWTFGSFANHYIENKLTSKALPLREGTKKNYYRYLERGLRSLYAVPLQDVSKVIVTDWYKQQIAAGKVSTTSKEYKFIHAVMAFAIDNGYYTEANPCQIKGAMSAATGVPTRALTMDDVVALSANINPRYKNMILIMANAALRFGEATALKRKDIEFVPTKSGSIRVRLHVRRAVIQLSTKKFLEGPTKSDHGVRVIPLNSQLIDAITTQLASLVDLSEDALLFPSANGTYLRNDVFNTAIKRAQKKMGVDGTGVSAHSLRRSGATALANVGGNVTEVKDFLGDSSEMAALRYIKSTNRTADLIERISTGL